MILTLLFTVVFIASILFLSYAKKNWDDPIVAWILFVIFGLVFLINSICVASGVPSTRAYIKKFEATRTTIKEQRSFTNMSDYERVQLTQTIVTANGELAEHQYWANSLWFNWYYDKAILNVEPIR